MDPSLAAVPLFRIRRGYRDELDWWLVRSSLGSGDALAGSGET
jgi:hypothetical protein